MKEAALRSKTEISRETVSFRTELAQATSDILKQQMYADDQPLPKLGQPDPDFKANKWMSIAPSPAKP
jgi:hypothetical protein